MLAAAIRSFDVEQVRNITVISLLIDTLSEENIGIVADELDSLLFTRKPRRVVVDLVRLRFIDDLGLAMLQSFHDGIEELGGTAILCRLAPAVFSAMNEVGLNRQLHIRHSRDEAIWTF